MTAPRMDGLWIHRHARPNGQVDMDLTLCFGDRQAHTVFSTRTRAPSAVRKLRALADEIEALEKAGN